MYYDTDWNPLPKDQFAALQRDLVSASRWVIDGNYPSSLPIRLAVADAVIFLDRCPYHLRTGQFTMIHFSMAASARYGSQDAPARTHP